MPKPNWLKEHESESDPKPKPKKKTNPKTISKVSVKSNLQITDLKPKEFVPFPTQWLPLASADMFCIEARGHGMEPDVKSGDYLMCAKTDCYEHGDIVILFNGTEAHCKYYLKHGNRVVYQNARKEIFDAKGFVLSGKVVSKYGHMLRKK